MESESLGLELKQTVENFKEISKAACAFANAVGGKIIIGISNDGRVYGVANGELDSLQQRSEGAVQQVSPTPFHKILVEKRENKKIVVIEIYQIGQGAFCTFGGIVYYRSGSLNVKLEGRTLQDYLVKRHILSFDEMAARATINDIDANTVKEFLQKRSPSVTFKENQLADTIVNLGVAQKNGELIIKNSAILLFAKKTSQFPQNEVKLVRFKGTQPIDIIDTQFVNETITQNLKEAENFIKKNTQMAFKIEKLERKEIPEYPTKVIREALVNALAHRDYFSKDATQINIFDDRIEFLNPGTLPNGLSIQILGTLSIARNPLTYRLMRDIGLVEGLATGIPRIRSELKSAGFPQPRFEELGSFFRVTIYNKNWLDHSELNERQKRVLAYLEKNHSITTTTLKKLTGVSNPAAVADLNKLTLKGLVKKIGKTRGAYYTLNKPKT